MNILILGKGYIGTKLNSFLNDGWDRDHKIHHCSKEELNYHSYDVLSDFITNKNIDLIVNTSGFTGYPNVEECEIKQEESFFLNVKVPLIIERACKDNYAKFINVSSGCIYSGYDKEYTEEDTPDFGIYDDVSSFYSKCKHISELVLDTDFTNILRIRMPIDGKFNHKNLINKLLKYDNLIDFKNSKTDTHRLCELINTIKDNFKPGIYNAVHSNPLSTSQVCELMKSYDLYNENWEFLSYEDLNFVANRSNCVLSNQKILDVFNFDFGPEEYYLKLNCSLLQKQQGWDNE